MCFHVYSVVRETVKYFDVIKVGDVVGSVGLRVKFSDRLTR